MSSAIFKFIANAVLRLTRLLSEIFLSTCAGQDNHSAAAAAADSEGSEAEQESNKYVTLMPPPPSGLYATLLTPQSSTSSPSENLAGLSLSMSRETGDSIPQDDSMSALRSKIHQINSLQTEQATKAKLIHEVLLQGYRASRPHMETPSPGRELPPGAASAQRRTSAPGSRKPPKSCQNGVGESAAVGEGQLTEADLSPTYAPVAASNVHPPLGCAHYERNVKLQCPTCTRCLQDLRPLW
ncbi:hypothetical protein NLG97_g9931 [Lecanicillium saksenae]|uniref:Uncharacterized protein n=1 Tax=Lecanicillium saksenae TaxID=468837 RepID=A0ACC1QEL7_9HYPO|nr:hypothetical protein NLG97_g9931 [Lecanicillium saksenae]